MKLELTKAWNHKDIKWRSAKIPKRKQKKYESITGLGILRYLDCRDERSIAEYGLDAAELEMGCSSQSREILAFLEWWEQVPVISSSSTCWRPGWTIIIASNLSQFTWKDSIHYATSGSKTHVTLTRKIRDIRSRRHLFLTFERMTGFLDTWLSSPSFPPVSVSCARWYLIDSPRIWFLFVLPTLVYIRVLYNLLSWPTLKVIYAGNT